MKLSSNSYFSSIQEEQAYDRAMDEAYRMSREHPECESLYVFPHELINNRRIERKRNEKTKKN